MGKIVTDDSEVVVHVDKKWMYTTNRRRKLKYLPRDKHEKENTDHLKRPKAVSRRHPVKVMVLGAIANPNPSKNFDGKVMLERVSKKKW